MLKNYIKIAWRNLLKNKTYSIINIVGLAIGLGCFLLISLYVMDELSYDRFNEKADRIYRIDADIIFGGSELRLATSSDPMGATLKADYPEVEAYTRLYTSSGSKFIKKGDQFIVELAVGHADSTVFNVFTMPFIAGNPDRALTEPKTVVISESAAIKYFGTTDVLNKTLETTDDEKTLYKITGVMKDIPHNAHFQFDFLFSMHTVNYGFGNYLSHNFHTFIVLQEGIDPQYFESKLPEYVDNHVLPQAQAMMNIKSMDEFRKSGNDLVYSLMPLTKIHLYSDRHPELGINGNVQYVYIFGAVAIFILLIACVNFMNLATARSSKRSKEVGIRKVLGTRRNKLVRQFLAESTLTAFISLVIALLLAWLMLPFFNHLSTKSMSMLKLFQAPYIYFLCLLPLIVGTLAGSYPAFFLSAFQPIVVLKGKLNAGVKRSVFRNSLVVFQFVTSIFLIVGTIVVYNQLNYIQTKKLGFNKEQVLILDGTGVLGNNLRAFKNEIGSFPGVKTVSYSGYLPVQESSRSDRTFFKSAATDPQDGLNMQTWRIDYDYLQTLGMEMKQGRAFSEEFGTDSSAIIINETTATLLGYDDPIGKQLYVLEGDPPNREVIAYNIIGMVENFHFESLRQTIAPLCFVLGESRWTLAAKVETDDMGSLISKIESTFKSMAPGMPFHYRFLDDSFDNMYNAEQRVGIIAFAFSILAIFIACLGLFGLATYIAEQRTKEIGIRKVVGAGVDNIAVMLSKDFMVLILIAFLFSFPLAGWAMNRWLQDFAFRIEISWWIYLVAGVMAMAIALLTVGYQAVRAGRANPVDSLRNE